MPRYAYMARTTAGVSAEGQIAARSVTEASKLLRADGKFVVKLSEVTEAIEEAVTGPTSFGGTRVKTDDVIFFANQLAVMVDTGVPITEALQGIIDQTKSPAFKAILEKVLAEVQTGQPLSVALAMHPKAFRPLFVSLVRASEASGKLGPMLDRCAAYMRAQRDTRKKVVGAMIYPVFLMIMSLVVTIFLLTFLLPKFTAIYAGRESLLPTPTKVLIAISTTFTSNALWFSLGAVLIPLALIMFFRSSAGIRKWHWMTLHVPLLGRMFHQTYLARSIRTLGTLVDSGVSMLDSVAITRAVVTNSYFQDVWDAVDTRIQRGEQLSTPLYDSRLFPRSVSQMIQAGERTGHLAMALERVADFIEEDLNQTIKRVTQMIEPIMIFVMGTIVGNVAIALLLPIFTISKTLQQ